MRKIRKIINSERAIVEVMHSLTSYTVRVPGRLHPLEEVGTLEPVWFDVGEAVTVGYIDPEGGAQIPVILEVKPWLVAAQQKFNLMAWRWHGSWQFALGAEHEAEIPGEALALTGIDASFQYVPVIVEKRDGSLWAIAHLSSNYDDKSLVTVFNFDTGIELWESPVIVHDAFPTLEYVPELDAVFCSGYRELETHPTEFSTVYKYQDRLLLLDFNTGNLIKEFPESPEFIDLDDVRRYLFTVLKSSVSRFVLPDPAGRFFELAVRHRTNAWIKDANSLAESDSNVIEGRDLNTFSPGVLHENTKMIWNQGNPRCTAGVHDGRLVRSYTGLGFRFYGREMEAAEHEFANWSLFAQVTKTSLNMPMPRDTTKTAIYNKIEADRIAVKVVLERRDGSFAEWVRSWNANDTDLEVVPFANTAEELRDSWKTGVEAAITSDLGGSAAAAISFWDVGRLELTMADPLDSGLSADLLSPWPGLGGGSGYGFSPGVSLVGRYRPYRHLSNGVLDPQVAVYYTESDDNVFMKVLDRDGSISPSPGESARQNVTDATIRQVRTNLDKLVVNYGTPSRYKVTFQAGAGGVTSAFKLGSGRTGGLDRDVGFFKSGAGDSSIIDSHEDLPDGSTPSTTRNNYLVGDSIHAYYDKFFTSSSSSPSWVPYHNSGSFPGVGRFLESFTVGNSNGLEILWKRRIAGSFYTPGTNDPIAQGDYYSDWVDNGLGWLPFDTGAAPDVIDYIEDLEHIVIPSPVLVPVNGKSAVTVLQEVEGDLVEKFTLEFGGYHTSGGADLTYRPYVNGTPGRNGLWIDRVDFAYPAVGFGNHTMLIERYDWDGALLWSHEAPGNPWNWFVVCGFDPVTGKDWLLLQNSDDRTLHLYDEEGFVRSYTAVSNAFYNGSVFVVGGSVFYTEYNSEELLSGDQYTYVNRIVRL